MTAISTTWIIMPFTEANTDFCNLSSTMKLIWSFSFWMCSDMLRSINWVFPPLVLRDALWFLLKNNGIVLSLIRLNTTSVHTRPACSLRSRVRTMIACAWTFLITKEGKIPDQSQFSWTFQKDGVTNNSDKRLHDKYHCKQLRFQKLTKNATATFMLLCRKNCGIGQIHISMLSV